MADTITNETAEGMDMDILNQENVSQRACASRRSIKQNIRHRASIACFSCRDRRIRCVVPKGGSGCTQCQRSGTECVIKMDDERRRPISKVYVSSLSARIDMLEGMLREKGVVVPPATHPPMTKHEALPSSSGDELRISTSETRRLSKADDHSSAYHLLSPPDSHHDFGMFDSPTEDSTNKDLQHLKKRLSTGNLDLKQGDSIRQLFSPKGGLSFDRLSDGLRYFGSTANSHVYADSPDRYDPREPSEQVRRAERIIRSLTPKTHDHLMQNFWSYHNSVLQVVDRDVFEADRGSEKPKYYSSFLHIVILAVGWRFADKDRCDIARLNLGNRESTLHREARYMLDVELERPMGIPSVQSLLLLADLECGVGRDNTGWMYAGMANRLAFDIGLHTDCSAIGLSDRESSVRGRVMKACILYDRYWALFLGRPTSIKNRDVGLDFLSKRCPPTSHPIGVNVSPPPDTQAREEEIHEQLLELMDLAGQIAERRNDDRSGRDTTEDTGNSAYMRVLTLDQQLRGWYARLPDHLTWKVVNTRAAPFSYFLLHQQYNATMILLHRSWEYDRWTSENGSATSEKASGIRHQSVSDEEADSEDRKPSVLDNRTPLARSVCTQAAIQFAQVLSQSRQRYNVEKMGFTSLQPAGAASTALLAAIAYTKDETDRRSYLSYLGVITDAIRSMSQYYQPALRMGSLIQAVLSQLHLHPGEARDGKAGEQLQIASSKPFTILPIRRENGDKDQLLGNSNKRPRTTSFHYDSRPAPPFDMPPSPPLRHHLPFTTLPSQHHSNSIPGFLSNFSDAPNEFFDLDSLRTLAMGGGDTSTYEHQQGFALQGSVSDNYLRVAPSGESWGLHSLHATSALDPPVAPSFDSHSSPMLGWVGGGGGVAASLHQQQQQQPDLSTTKNASSLSSAAAAEVNSSSSPMLSSSLSNNNNNNIDNNNENHLTICKTEDVAGTSGCGLAWMSGENEFDDALTTPTPVSSSNNSRRGDKNDHVIAIPPRNHELDFLSF